VGKKINPKKRKKNLPGKDNPMFSRKNNPDKKK
jgi:hypothetical protein